MMTTMNSSREIGRKYIKWERVSKDECSESMKLLAPVSPGASFTPDVSYLSKFPFEPKYVGFLVFEF